MAKRFADTNLSDESWYRRLSPTFKAAWRYLTDKCDSAGCWSIDAEAMDFHVGAPVNFEEFLKAVNADKPDRLVVFDDRRKLLIPGFVGFQYGVLKPDCKPHQPVIKRCRELEQLEGYPKGIDTLKEKEKDTDQEKETDKDPEKESPASPEPADTGADPETAAPAKRGTTEFVRLWNDVAGVKLPKAVGLSKDRAKRIAERLREEPDLNVWAVVFQKIRDSDFCNGLTEQGGWRADFDWVLQPSVRLKVLEGRYDNRTGPGGPKPPSDPFAKLRARQEGK